MVLLDLQRPWLVRDSAVRRIDHEAGSGLDAKAITMFFDVLRGERPVPVSLHIRMSIRGAWRD